MRKVLSFVLVLSLVLGSFSMAFAAAPSDVADSPNKEAITVGVNLGIIDGFEDGTYKPTQAVTRAEFAKLMTKALGIPDSALAGYSSTSFKDVSGAAWAVPFLGFCQSKGIMIGDGNGNVRPSATISVNEGMTMIMRAIGYTENSAALVGTWPAKYVSLAKNNNMYDDVANAVTLDRANAAQVIYNALTVDKVEVAADGTTKVLTQYNSDGIAVKNKIVNMLTTGLNCTAETTIIRGNEESMINLKPYVGKEATVYKSKDKPYAIVAIAAEETTGIVGKIKDNTNKVTYNNDNDTFDFGSILKFAGSDDVDYKVAKSTDVSIFVNGETIDTEPANATKVPTNASITLNGDVSGKTISNVKSINVWNTAGNGNAKRVAQTDLNQLKDERLLGFDFETSKDGSINANSFDLIGVSALDKIAVDNVVYVYTNTDKDITRVEVGTETVTGEVTMVKSDKYTVDGKAYEFSSNVKTIEKTERPVAGDDVIMYLDADGYIFDVKNNTGSNDKYAVVSSDAAVKDEYRFYTASDNDEVWITTKSDARKAIDPTAALDKRLIGYSLNNKGEMTSATNAGIIKSTSTAKMTASTVINIDGTPYVVKSDAVVFAISNGAITDATTAKNVETKDELNTAGHDVVAMKNSKNQIVAMIIGEEFTSKTAKDNYGVIDGVGSTTDPTSKDKVQQLFGFLNNEKLDKLTEDSDTVDSTQINAPGLWEIKLTSDGKVKDAILQGTDAGGYGVTVKAIRNSSETFELSNTSVAGLADNAIVYRADIVDGDVDAYSATDKGSINEGDTVYFYDTDKDEAGYEYVIYVTRW